MPRKIGIFAPWGAGDLVISSSVLKYKDEKWPNDRIVWFCLDKHADLLAHNPHVHEIRGWPWRRADVGGAFKSAQDGATSMLTDRKRDFPFMADIDEGYFSAPWLCMGIIREADLVDMPRRVFGVPDGKPWHPMVFFSREEDDEAGRFFESIPRRKTVMMETVCNSGQSSFSNASVSFAIEACRSVWGECNILFASPGAAGGFSQQPGVFDISARSIRRCIPFYNRCDLFVGVSSGISCTTCSWTASDRVPRVEYCDSRAVSTQKIARGPQTLVRDDAGLINAIKDAIRC